jgi:hypothetical protein
LVFWTKKNLATLLLICARDALARKLSKYEDIKGVPFYIKVAGGFGERTGDLSVFVYFRVTPPLSNSALYLADSDDDGPVIEATILSGNFEPDSSLNPKGIRYN